jgi:hypothetical protein
MLLGRGSAQVPTRARRAGFHPFSSATPVNRDRPLLASAALLFSGVAIGVPIAAIADTP